MFTLHMNLFLAYRDPSNDLHDAEAFSTNRHTAINVAENDLI